MNKMINITFFVIGAALIVTGLIYLGKALMEEPKELEYQTVDSGIAGYSSQTVAGAGPSSPHIVIVPSLTFNTLFAYGASHGITVSDSLVIAVQDWGKGEQTQSVIWRPMDIDSKDVQINIIKKTGSNPDTYDLLGKLGTTTNSGSFTYVKNPAFTGLNTFVEIGCVPQNNECKSLKIASY